ncbi:hypothetical protein [Inquilinus limosus]|mgnify:CR=1 FL=1|uniref:hypothetical protein n=1 Tax=Inquilinus limosus TaxID=171674 RepID=UPI0013770F36|nr:hypothetical protein [Inquilinus limosus]
MEPVDYVEVGRMAYELAVTHGHPWDRLYAARLAKEALARGDADAYRFWRAVELTLTPR